jgi:hypothetical protein
LEDEYDHLAKEKHTTGGTKTETFSQELVDDDFLPDYFAKDAP